MATGISAYLRGEEITVETLAAIAIVLDCSTDFLLGREKPTPLVSKAAEEYKPTREQLKEREMRLRKEILKPFPRSTGLSGSSSGAS